MARGDQVDAELLRGRVVRLLGLAGEKRVEALVSGADQVVARGAGGDGEPRDPVRAGAEHEWLAPERVEDTSGQLGDREVYHRAAEAEAAERALGGGADPRRQ